MSRLSIDVTDEEHKTLKAMAALHGKTIKEFVLERTLGNHAGKGAEEVPGPGLLAVEAFLEERLRESLRDGTSNVRVREIFDKARRERHG